MSAPPPPAPEFHGPFEPLSTDRFCFACHPGVPCFNRCCADLTLALTPYDLLRLKAGLGLTSDEVLETYADILAEDASPFPRLKLKMSAQKGRPCPFVSPSGCTIYGFRPGACRIYPLGRGSARGGHEMFFLVREEHCRGFEEPREWTIREWMADQGLKNYNASNDLWMEIITSRAPLGPPEQAEQKLKMFFMASYNLDRFRAFIFDSRFLERFEVEKETVESMRTDEAALLRFGFRWLRFALFGESTLRLRAGH